MVQSTIVALLTATGGPYFVTHERESGGGFYDLALAPQLDQYSSDPALVAEWRIGNGVTPHRLVLVFHGGDAILAEEV